MHSSDLYNNTTKLILLEFTSYKRLNWQYTGKSSCKGRPQSTRKQKDNLHEPLSRGDWEQIERNKKERGKKKNFGSGRENFEKLCCLTGQAISLIKKTLAEVERELEERKHWCSMHVMIRHRAKLNKYDGTAKFSQFLLSYLKWLYIFNI